MRANAANVTIRELQQKMRESGVLFQKGKSLSKPLDMRRIQGEY